jgi:uncharacterized protein
MTSEEQQTWSPTEPQADTARHRPGWPEIGAGAVVYGVLIYLGIQWIRALPEGPGSGIVEFLVSGLAGGLAFLAAFLLRRRVPGNFGFRRAAPKWLLIGAGLGVAVYLLNIVVAIVAVRLTGATNPQGDYQTAASSGVLTLILTLAAGIIVTPIGEELLFRGVLTNALGRYGSWVSVLVSAAVFAAAHGWNVILPIAFTVGVLNALLIRKTGSIWPGVVLHGVNNLLPLLLAASVAGVG